MTMGAPHRCVTLCSAMASNIGLGAHPAQAHVRARHRRQRPGEAPAVAVEHRQGPQVDRVPAEVGGEHVGVAHERRAAVAVDDALGIAGGARGVVERQRLPLVLRHAPAEPGVARGEERLVVRVGQRLGRLRELLVVVVDDERPAPWPAPAPLASPARTRGRRSPPWCRRGRAGRRWRRHRAGYSAHAARRRSWARRSGPRSWPGCWRA